MGTHPIFESDFDCLTEVRITQNSSQHAARKKLQGSPRCRRSLFNQEEEGSQRAKPALRKATKELRNWPGHPTETRLDPLRAMAQVHPSPATKGRSPKATQGPANDQPIQPVLGQTVRRRILQARAKVPTGKPRREEGPTLGSRRAKGWRRCRLARQAQERFERRREPRHHPG